MQIHDTLEMHASVTGTFYNASSELVISLVLLIILSLLSLQAVNVTNCNCNI